ncbi:MAG: radical SAM protein, partial [Myxococcota bacterium]
MRTPAEALADRRTRPQRHRLLHGYPMTPLLRAPPPVPDPRTRHHRTLRESLSLDPTRELIVGVLPHTQCAPTVEGCGFCTFPHDPAEKPSLRHVVHAVGQEIAAAPAELRARSVTAVYLGGATANLTPPAQLRALLTGLGSTFSLSGAEITLEGVPSLFLAWWGGPLEALRDGPGAHKRVSMGVQTFDIDWLGKMGRLGFGDRRTVERVVERAHSYGMTASGDFLLGLPGRPAADELEDLRVAAELGLDQICVYPLVLAGDTPWARDPAMRAAMPGVEEGRGRWRAACAQLLAAGYAQTTLTNFERGAPRFRYEVASFAPDRTDAVGFGPLAISTFVDPAARRAVKTQRARTVEPTNVDLIGLWFPYDAEDLSLLFVTRCLAVLRIDRARYRAFLGADLLEHHGPTVQAVVDAGLATLDDEALTLTPDGTWFADAVAGTFAEARAEAVRA